MSFAEEFTSFFRVGRKSAAEHARCYLAGLVQAEHGRKNIERMAEVVPHFDYQGVQQFISDSPWEAGALMHEVARQADGLLGGASDSRLILDDSSMSKKGHHSAGVARQYNGNLGKVDSCQNGVFASLSAGVHATPAGVRLYLPEAWCSDAARCEKAGVPEENRVFKTKPELALELVIESRQLGLRFGMICADGGYGQASFLRALDGLGESFVIEVHCDQRIYTEAPWPMETPTGRRMTATPAAAVRMDQWRAGQPEGDWERLKIRDTTGGWVEVNYVARRCWLWDGTEAVPRCWWVLAWQNPDEGPEARVHYALSNAPADADPRRLVSHGVHRYWIERNFQDAKSEAGLADYQVRGWLGWHHHVAMVMLAMLFILREKVLHAPSCRELSLSAGDVVFLLTQLLPRRIETPDDALDILEQRRSARLYDQRRKRERTARSRPPLLPLEDLTK